MKKSSKLTSLSIFFPCYNEEHNIPILVKKIQKVAPQLTPKYEIIIVNDGSTDSSGSIADELAQTFKNITVIHHPQNLGYGASIRTGFANARYQWVFFTDGDNQFNITELKKFVPFTSIYDAIIGFRKKRAEGFIRNFNTQLFKIFIDCLYRLHVIDISCAFKLFKTNHIKKIQLTASGAMISTELLYQLKKKGIAFKQLPVTHYPRRFGTPTGNHPKVIVRAFIEALTLYLRMKIS